MITKTTTTKRAYKKRSTRYGKRRSIAVSRAVRRSHGIKYFTEFFQASAISTSLGINTAGSLNVNLQSLPNHNSYINLFDQFCIIKWEVHLLQKMGTMNNNVGGLPITMVTAVNRDGSSAANTGTTAAQIMSEDNSRVYNLLGNTPKITIKVPNPKPYLLEYQGDSVTNVSIPIQEPLRQWKWLDTTRGQAINYYGINYHLYNPSSLDLPVFDVYYKVTIAVKEQQ